jgi:hypothetical protein
MFPHAFPDPLELTDSSSKEDRRGIADGDGRNVWQAFFDSRNMRYG